MRNLLEQVKDSKEWAFFALVGAEQGICALVPRWAFPEEVPGIRQALDDVSTRRLAIQREILPLRKRR